MENYYRSDLAVEALRDITQLPDGATYRENITDSGYKFERLTVDKNASASLGRPAGNYVTINCGRIWELDDNPFTDLAGEIASELMHTAERLTKKKLSGSFGVLVAGLGNSQMTPDAVGPETVSRLNVTRHLAEENPSLFENLGCCRISAVTPGVLGQTGIETVQLIQGAVQSSKPDVVIAVDALAARSCLRLATTVQISDTGISPGSGIGNRRGALNSETLGVPVITLGIPTVVDSSTLVFDALESAGITDFSDKLKQVLDNGRSYFVSPKECDIITKSISRLFASALNIAFGINFADES